jgi:DNA repair photolyase
MELWYNKNSVPTFDNKISKSILHPFTFGKYRGHTLNVYQGCQHRCGYCYATYEWSPEFYDKIYAKSNAPELLENEIRKWRSGTIEPVMISSATDSYQPAELKFELTRKCVNILQKYNIPYYVFTKSSLIYRDLELHERYKDNCFIVWSITTCNENIRRCLEPGTPPASIMFKIIRNFANRGVRCAVNIDPIVPLITDSFENINTIITNCRAAGVKNVFGAFLRIRFDIWKRMKIVFKLLNVDSDLFVTNYNKLYNFTDPIRHDYNLRIDRNYEIDFMQNLEKKIRENGMTFDFPSLKGISYNKNLKFKNVDKNQLTLTNYV